MEEERQEIILKTVSRSSRPHLPHSSRACIGLFSLILICTLLFGVYQWYSALLSYLQHHSLTPLDSFKLSQIIQLQNTHSFQQTILKYKVYLAFTCGYVEPNIILALCILITIPLVICSIEKENATTIVFYEYNGISMYLQMLRLGLDFVQYLMTGRCFCLNSGAAAVWINMLLKIFYHRFSYFSARPLLALPLMLTLIAGISMVLWKARLDLLLGVLTALIQLAWMHGGTVKYPKQVFQQKQNWLHPLRVDRLPLWYPFRWNDYLQNPQMCLDSEQFYLFKEERLAMIYR